MKRRRTGLVHFFARARDSRTACLITLTLVAAAVHAPSLSQGLYGDDYVHRRFILTHLRGSAPHVPWWNMFDSRLAADAAPWESGSLFSSLPWWAAPDFKLSLLRPLSTASQFLDYRLWPESPWAMHAHNVFLACATALIAGLLYWQVFPSRLAAWLALLFFVLDGATAISTSWIASRNTILTGFFVLLTLLTYIRVPIIAPMFLLCAHASSEGAIVAWAYLIAFAWCLDSRPRPQKLRASLPLAAVTCGWFILSTSLGYGAQGSGTYVDPRADLGLFLRTAAGRLPRLLEHQLGIQLDYVRAVAPAQAGILYCIGLFYIASVIVGACIYFRRSRLVRFFALSYLGALAPLCAVDSFDRLLPLSSFAAHGIVIAVGAELLDSICQRATAIGRTALALFAAVTVWIHGLVAWAMPYASAEYGKVYDASIVRAATSLPTRPLGGRIVALAFPDYLRSALIDVYRRELVPLGPRRLDFITISPGPVRVTRTSHDELELDAGDSMLTEQSTLLVRRLSDRFRVGQQFSLAGLDIEVASVTSDGRPSRVRLTGQNLASPGWLWVQWSAREQRFVQFVLPPEGASSLLER